MTPLMTRAFKSLAFAAAAIVAMAPAAFADKKSEAYVEQQANAVLKVLNDASITDEQRKVKFAEYMHKFANFPNIARRVLGAEGRSLTQAEFDRYYKTFEQYAMSVYEVQLQGHQGDRLTR
jgi:ABC-type transporter MlaC component